MTFFHGYCASYSGILLLGIIQGVCVLADGNTVTLHRALGSSLTLPLGYQKESVTHAEWKFIKQRFVVFDKKQLRITNDLQFKGRLKMDNINVSVEVEALTVQDSGTFSIVIDGTSGQFPTKFINLKVYAQIESINIETNQTWLGSTKACDVQLLCQAFEDQNSSYTWSGYQNGSGALLHFTFTPEEGDIILNCTAANRVSKQTATKTLTCRPDYIDLKLLIWTAAGGGAALLLLITAIALSCWWKSHKDANPPDCGNTVYADVNPAQKRKQSQCNVNGASIYETVDDLRSTSNKDKPQTLYDKVTFSRSTTDQTNTSSPYQDVL